jgi:DNA modification methylase
MAKTTDDVAKSRDRRDAIVKHFGFIPESILKHDPSDRAIDLLVDEHGRDYASTFHQPENVAREFGKVTAEERNKQTYYLSGAGARWGALSRFPQKVGRALLRLYTDRGMTVVDPFAGHNSRMQLCYCSGRNYIGCDISHAFMEANFKLREMLLGGNAEQLEGMSSLNKATIELHEVDSRLMNHCDKCVKDGRRIEGSDCKHPVKSNVGDFTITSPPYWDLEYYGDEMGQLGKDNDYPEFLRRLGDVAKQNFRCLKSGAFCVWCINDFRKDGKFYAYHIHTAQLLRDAGFKQHDCAIIDLGGSFGQAFASQIIDNKILPKRHEYALIFVKP